MSRRCTICDHPQRHDIETALVSSRDSNRAVARQFCVKRDALRRHVESGHVAQKLAKAAEATQVSEATDLLARAQQLLADARAIHAEAMGAFDHKTALQAIREQARVLDLLGRLLGELGSGAAVHLHAHRHEVAATALVTPAAVEHLAGVALDWAERHRAPETVPLLESADE